ncbi:MAG: N-glycosylase/DNA lyase [Euryarchaeota archaeon]|nr:N-glycosylase/DNA lyase [Euryarchaeota archaeon]
MIRGDGCAIPELTAIRESMQGKIQSRLDEFRRIRERGDAEEVFVELVFCLLTPQSKARVCWAAVQNLLEKNLLFDGTSDQISGELHGVRFKYRKAEYIIKARDMRDQLAEISRFDDACDAREWLVQNVLGIGYKEASHFLRNIGYGESLAILDRHILKNLKLLGVIEEIPKSLSKKTYLEIEKGMRELADEIRIPMSQLDLVMWCKETGEVFK